MNILLIDCSLGMQTKHTVRTAHWPGQGAFVPVQFFLQQVGENGRPFQPDILIQKEHIGRRVFLDGLWDLACPKIFWAVDSHLNLYWQRFYGQLFDLVLTPHTDIFAKMPQNWQLPRVERLTCPGSMRIWRGHEKRQQMAAFVGRIDSNRDQRQRFARFLQKNYGVEPQCMPYEEMLQYYEKTRILPNESICGEFNFRIMEGASCGCCVLTEDIGPDLEANFEPGREVLTYRHVQELDDELRFLSSRPRLSENIGKAAKERVQRCHLPEHRYETLLRHAASLTAHTTDRTQEQRAYVLACAQWARGNPAQSSLIPHIMQQLKTLDEDWQVLAMRLRLEMEVGQLVEARNILIHLLGVIENMQAGDWLDAMTAALSMALRIDDPDLIDECRKLWQRMGQNISMPQTKDRLTLCLSWADLLVASGRLCQPGFLFSDTGQQCPETAIEMLLAAKPWLVGEQDTKRWISSLARISAQTPLTSLTLGFSAHHSLYHGSDWRVGLEHAYWNLRSYRLEEGLEEAAIAHQTAVQKGEENAFQAEALRLGIRLA